MQAFTNFTVFVDNDLFVRPSCLRQLIMNVIMKGAWATDQLYF